MGSGGIVAVLFSDLVRSTELWSSLGGADAETLRSRHHRACVAAVEQAGGSVVKNLGDGLMATFPTVSAALDAAVGLQRATAVVARAASTTALELRVGVALGEAWTENGDWFGVPVVEAARLCATAQPGQILVADGALTFVRESSHEWSSVGALTLKGLPDPVSASALRWDATLGGPVPLPPLVQHHPSDLAFVGRADAMRILRDANARSGRVHLVVVTGEPGIGKTRLVSEFAREVHAEGAIVLAGSCDESSIVPYQPFTETCRFLAPRRPASEVPKALACLIPAMAQVLGAPDAGDSPFDRLAVADGVVEWLVSLAVTAPVVLILDDLHWASLETLNLVRHVVKSADDERILIVATYRDTDLDRAHPLAAALADWRRLGQTPRVSLTGLGATDVEDLLRVQGGGELDDDGRRLAAALHAETEGNAYFVDQVLAHLIETGRLGLEGGRWSYVGAADELGLPQGVREVVGRRLSHLSSLANEVLALAAVAGRTFDPEVVRRASSSGRDEVLDAFDEAVSAQLIREESDAVNRYAFTHSLVRQTLLDELSALRRARLHQRIAGAIEECYPADDAAHAADMTSHLLEAAAVGELDRAIDLLFANRSRFDPSTQLDLAERALESADELGTDPRRRAAVNIVVAETARFVTADDGQTQIAADRAIALAREIGDRPLFADAVVSRDSSPSSLADPETLSLVAEALSGVDPLSRQAVRLRVMVATANAVYNPGRSDPAAAFEQLILDSAGLSKLDRAFVLNNAAYWGYVALPAIERVRQIQQFCSTLDTNLDRADDIVLGLRLEPISVEAQLDLRLEFAERHSVAWWIAVFGFLKATLQIATGNFEAASRVIERVERASGGRGTYSLISACQRWVIDGMRGDAGVNTGARSPIGALKGRFPRAVHALDGVDSLRAGDRAAAERDFEGAWADGADSLAFDWSYTATLGGLAKLAAGLGRVQEAREIDSILEPFDGQFLLELQQNISGSVAFLRGLLACATGELEAGIAHFERAAEMETRNGLCALLVGTQVNLAEALIARGGPGDAVRALDLALAAHAEAERITMRPVVERAAALLV